MPGVPGKRMAVTERGKRHDEEPGEPDDHQR
jgi:hypothetical protein